MRWATRARIHIDRAASAWLIATHIDPDAEFVYVDDPRRRSCPPPRKGNLFDSRSRLVPRNFCFRFSLSV